MHPFQQDTRTRADLPNLSLNILPVYELGYNGTGVRVCVLDDGLEHTHDDLKDNYVRKSILKIESIL